MCRATCCCSGGSLQKQQSIHDYETDYSEYNSPNPRLVDSVASSPLTPNQNFMSSKQVGHQSQVQQQQQQQDTTTSNVSNDDAEEVRRMSYMTANRKHTLSLNTDLQSPLKQQQLQPQQQNENVAKVGEVINSSLLLTIYINIKLYINLIFIKEIY